MRRNTVAGVCGPAAKRPVGGDLTYVATWRGFVDVAFVIFARRVPDHHCRTVSPITLIRQYRFATLKFLQTRPGSGRCTTVPLRNPVHGWAPVGTVRRGDGES